MFGNLFLKKMLERRWVGWRQDPVIKVEIQGRAKCSDLRGISGCFGAAVGAPWPRMHDMLTRPTFGQVWSTAMLVLQNTCFDT